jgi:hypothetical protein
VIAIRMNCDETVQAEGLAMDRGQDRDVLALRRVEHSAQIIVQRDSELCARLLLLDFDRPAIDVSPHDVAPLG